MDVEGGSFLAVGCYTIYIMAVMVGGRYGGMERFAKTSEKNQEIPNKCLGNLHFSTKIDKDNKILVYLPIHNLRDSS